MESHAEHFDIAIIGAGLSGLAAATALARDGLRVALIGKPAAADLRTTALLAGSVEFLQAIGVWQHAVDKSHAMSTMRIVDTTSRLIRAPQIDFRAGEIGLENFGFNISNRDLAAAFETRLQSASLTRLPANLATAEIGKESALLSLDDGSDIEADMVVGADGRGSPVRSAAGIATRDWRYQQTAIVVNFDHDRGHGDASTEFHTDHGPFTVVPLGANRSSLVWVMEPARANQLLVSGDGELAKAIELQMHSMLGKVRLASSPSSFPMSGLIAERFGTGPVCLVGEAGHVFPPIGAQGFNLGLRDVAILSDVLDKSPRADDIGAFFHAARSSDIRSRTLSVDMLNRSLLSDFLPVQMVRAGVLGMLANVGPVRRLAMREGVRPGGQMQHLRERLAGIGRSRP